MTEFVIRSPITEGKSNYCGITQDLSDVEHSFLVTLGLGLKECTGISLLDQRGENFLCNHLEKQTSMLRGNMSVRGGGWWWKYFLWRFLLLLFLFLLGETKESKPPKGPLLKL